MQKINKILMLLLVFTLFSFSSGAEALAKGKHGKAGKANKDKVVRKAKKRASKKQKSSPKVLVRLSPEVLEGVSFQEFVLPSEIEFEFRAAIGLDRNLLTKNPEKMEERKKLLVESHEFAFYAKVKDRLAGMKRCASPEYTKYFKEAGEINDFPWKIGRAVAVLESNCNPFAVSPTGPRGLMQITGLTGKEIRNHFGWKKDFRYDPRLSAIGGMYYLKQGRDAYGPGFETWYYHSGPSRMNHLFAVANAFNIRKNVDDMYFLNSPIYNRGMYEEIKMLMGVDFSPTYPSRTLYAFEQMELLEKDPEAVIEKVSYYSKSQADSDDSLYENRVAVWKDFTPFKGNRLLKMVVNTSTTQVSEDFASKYKYSNAAMGAFYLINYKARELYESKYGKGSFGQLQYGLASGNTIFLSFKQLKNSAEAESLEFILRELAMCGAIGYNYFREEKVYQISPSPAWWLDFATIQKQFLNREEPKPAKVTIE